MLLQQPQQAGDGLEHDGVPFDECWQPAVVELTCEHCPCKSCSPGIGHTSGTQHIVLHMQQYICMPVADDVMLHNWRDCLDCRP
jgi:hypothetical protein